MLGVQYIFLTSFLRGGKMGIEHEKRLRKSVTRKEKARGETSRTHPQVAKARTTFHASDVIYRGKRESPSAAAFISCN